MNCSRRQFVKSASGLLVPAWMSPLAAQNGSVKVCPAPVSTQEIYFQDDFESGNLAAWDSVVGGANVTASTTFPRTGTYSLQIYYQKVGVGDVNRYVRKSLSPNREHVFARGYVYHKTPEPGAVKHPIQRKLFYFLSSLDSSGWWLVLTSDSQADGGITLRVSTNDSNYGGSAATISPQWDSGDYFWDNWAAVEMEVAVNTPGASDGVVNVWIDGILRISSTTAHIRGTDTGGLQNMRFGVQTDNTGTNTVEEYRYWDDIVIAKEYIGP